MITENLAGRYRIPKWDMAETTLGAVVKITLGMVVYNAYPDISKNDQRLGEREGVIKVTHRPNRIYKFNKPRNGEPSGNDNNRSYTTHQKTTQ